MSKFLSFCLIIILLSYSSIFADQVVMLNGDRLTGKIVEKDGETVTLETEVVGVVKINRKLIEKIVPDEAVAEARISAEKKTENKETPTNTETIAKVAVENKAVKDVVIAQVKKQFEAGKNKSDDAKFTEFWSGTLDVGFSLTSGNSKTHTFTGGLRAVRETPNNKLSIYANALQVKNYTSGKNITTAQSIWSGARYDININKKWFAYGAGDFEYNKPQKLNLRSVLGSGAGYHAIRNDRSSLDITFGVTNNYEVFSTGLTRNSAEASFGEELKQKINQRVKLNQRFVYYPNITRMGQFRALFDSSLQTDINSWLGMHLTIGNRYNSQPILQTKKNDFLLSTGIRVSFGKNRRK